MAFASVLRHMLLADKIAERLRPVLPRDHFIAHRFSLNSQFHYRQYVCSVARASCVLCICLVGYGFGIVALADAAIRGTSGIPRHTRLTRYRCSLPGLAGFAGNRCTEPEVPPIGSRAKFCCKSHFAESSTRFALGKFRRTRKFAGSDLRGNLSRNRRLKTTPDQVQQRNQQSGVKTASEKAESPSDPSDMQSALSTRPWPAVHSIPLLASERNALFSVA